MFSGIVEARGLIQDIYEFKEGPTGGLRFYIEAPFHICQDLKVGDSIAVNGACLTIAGFKKNIFSVDISPETVNRTYFKKMMIRDYLNLERPLKFSDRISGHWVTGHVDGVGKILDIKDLGEFLKMNLGFSETL